MLVPILLALSQKYLLLPVEDASPDVRISMIVNNKEVKNFDVRLAVNKVDYFVPVDLSDYSGKTISFKFKMNSNDPVRVNLSPDNTVVAAAGAGAAAEEEKTEFDVELTDVGPNKVKVIKVVREATGLGPTYHGSNHTLCSNLARKKLRFYL